MSVPALTWVGLCRVPAAGAKARSVLDAVGWRAADAGDPNLDRANPPIECPEGWSVCWAGVDELATRADADERTVRRVLARLERAGVLYRQRRYRIDGKQARRTTDGIYLPIAGPPVHVLRSADLSGQPARYAPAADELAGLDQADYVSGQTARYVASAEPIGHPGDLSGQSDRPLPGNLPPPLAGKLPGLSVQEGQDRVTRQEGAAMGSRQPESQRASASVGAREADQLDDADRVERAAAALGNRTDRRIPDGNAWAPLRALSGAAFEGMVDRVLADQVMYGLIEPDWHHGSPALWADVWRRVRAAMLRELTAPAAAPPGPVNWHVA